MEDFTENIYYRHDILNDVFANQIIFKGKKNGYFVDVGALDGVLCSPSHYFEKGKDWTGIIVEPNPYWADKIKNNRNCIIETSPLLDEEKEVTFVRHIDIPEYSKILENSESTNFPDNGTIEELKMKTLTLSSLLEKHNAPDVIDFLSIDIEGHEINVLSEFFKNSKRKINFIALEFGHAQSVINFFHYLPYVYIKNPFLEFLRIDKKTEMIVRWVNEGKGLWRDVAGNDYPSDSVYNLETIDWEHYFVHLDVIKENPDLKQYIIPTQKKTW